MRQLPLARRSFLRRKLSVELSGSFCIYIALLILLLPLQWFLAVLSAMAVHELCHILALMICRVPIARISLSASGVRLHTRSLSAPEQIICAAAGPLGGLVAASLLYKLPCFAFSAFMQSIYNLLPILPFDGGRILAGFCDYLPNGAGKWVLKTAKALTLLAILSMICWLTIYVKVIN